MRERNGVNRRWMLQREHRSPGGCMPESDRMIVAAGRETSAIGRKCHRADACGVRLPHVEHPLLPGVLHDHTSGIVTGDECSVVVEKNAAMNHPEPSSGSSVVQV